MIRQQPGDLLLNNSLGNSNQTFRLKMLFCIFAKMKITEEFHSLQFKENIKYTVKLQLVFCDLVAPLFFFLITPKTTFWLEPIVYRKATSF